MTMPRLSLLAVLAHPDDESMGVGGTLAKYASEGVETHLLCATRGERGWFGKPEEYPGPHALGQIRERELYAAADVLGIHSVNFLDECDGDLDRVEPTRVIARIAAQIREIRPDVVITFAPDGAYGHPDHIAISQLTTAAIMVANDTGYAIGATRPHQVQKFYYAAYRAQENAIYDDAFGELVMEIDGVARRLVAWPDWSITTYLDTTDHWQRVLRAILCHRTQLPGIDVLVKMPDERHRALWGTQTFYRAFSLVNGGRTVEDDLFAGLRQPSIIKRGQEVTIF